MSALHNIACDVRLTWRSNARRPAMFVIIVLMLALGIASNAVTFDVLDRLLLAEPAGVRDAKRVVRLYVRYGDRRDEKGPPSTDILAYPEVTSLGEDAHSFIGVAAFTSLTLARGQGSTAQPVKAELVTGNYFATLGVTPAAGRFFTAADDHPPSGEPVIIISYALWQGEFGGRSNAIGSRLIIDNEPLTVVGVAPRGFNGVDYASVDCWVPAGTFAPSLVGKNWDLDSGVRWLHVIARLQGSTSPKLAAARATEMLYGSDGNTAASDAPQVVLGSLIPARGPNGHGEAAVAIWLSGMSIALLAIACANVANLLLARAIARRREIALRSALGMNRWRLYQQFTVESAFPTLVAGCGACALTFAGSLATRRLLPDVAFPATLFGSSTLLYSGIVCLGVTFVVGLIPAIQAARPNDYCQLSGSVPEARIGRLRVRSVLMALQVTLASVLLFGAALFSGSLHNAEAIDLGVTIDHVLVALSRGAPTASRGQTESAFREAAARVARYRGVERTGIANTIPFAVSSGTRLALIDRDSLTELPGSSAELAAVTSSYFGTLGIHLRSGSLDSLSWEGSGSDHLAIVNDALSTLLWPNERAVGKCIIVTAAGASCREIIAVVGGARQMDLRETPKPEVFVPFGQLQLDLGTPALFVRADGDLDALAGVVRHELQEAGPSLPYVDVQTLASQVAPQMQSWRLGTVLFGMFALMAVAMAGCGVFAVAAYNVAHRQREFGIRIALGAKAESIMLLMIRQTMAVMASGLALGLLIVWLGGPTLDPLLMGITGHDGRALALVAGVIGAIALPACVVPAWAASKVNPAKILRAP